MSSLCGHASAALDRGDDASTGGARRLPDYKLDAGRVRYSKPYDSERSFLLSFHPLDRITPPSPALRDTGWEHDQTQLSRMVAGYRGRGKHG